MNKYVWIGVAASLFSAPLLANDPLPGSESEAGTPPVMPLNTEATIENIDATKRELAHLQEQLAIAKTRGELNRALSENQRDRAGDAMLEALQRDLHGLPPVERDFSQSPRPSDSVAPAPQQAALPPWSVYSTGGFSGDMRAVLISSQGQRISVRVGSETDAGRVTEIGHRIVKVRRGGNTVTLPTAVPQQAGTAPPVRTVEPFSRAATSFGGGGYDATAGGQ